jgi:hypothetical protein
MIYCYISSFHHLLGLIIFSPKKVVGQVFKYLNRKSHPKIKNQMIQIHAFKENRKEESKERPPTWWLREGSKFGAL